MAKFYVVNTITIGTQKFFAGQLIDDSLIDTTNFAAAGLLLWPDDSLGAHVVSDAGARAQAARLRGANEAELDSIMQTAVQSVQKSEDTAQDASGVSAATALAAILVHLTIDVPLATLQAKTSGTAFNIGAALPANARVLATETEVVQALAGGTTSAATAKLGSATDSGDDSLMGAVDVFTATGILSKAGSDPYQSRGAQQLKMKVTLTGDVMANLTAGHLKQHVYYSVLA